MGTPSAQFGGRSVTVQRDIPTPIMRRSASRAADTFKPFTPSYTTSSGDSLQGTLEVPFSIWIVTCPILNR